VPNAPIIVRHRQSIASGYIEKFAFATNRDTKNIAMRI